MEPPPESLTFRTAVVGAGFGGLLARSLVLAFVPWLLWWWFKPSISYCEDGTARGLSDKGECPKTLFPHWMVPLTGLLLALLA
jgi:hypothetical protein